MQCLRHNCFHILSLGLGIVRCWVKSIKIAHKLHILMLILLKTGLNVTKTPIIGVNTEDYMYHPLTKYGGGDVPHHPGFTPIPKVRLLNVFLHFSCNVGFAGAFCENDVRPPEPSTDEGKVTTTGRQPRNQLNKKQVWSRSYSCYYAIKLSNKNRGAYPSVRNQHRLIQA